jgi:hypothetical protein
LQMVPATWNHRVSSFSMGTAGAVVMVTSYTA